MVLREIAFDIVKLDMSLVKSHRRSDHNLMRWAMTCAQEMGATVVAEGIEGAEDLARVNDLGIPYGQGWHLDKHCQELPCFECPKNEHPEKTCKKP